MISFSILKFLLDSTPCDLGFVYQLSEGLPTPEPVSVFLLEYDTQCSYLEPLESEISFYFDPNEFGAPDTEAAN
jgi:hypothetical protein